MKNSNNKPVSIGEAARLTDVSAKQLRNWQSRGYIPEPERILCGKRSYRWFHSNDLQIISKIKSYLDEGYSLQTAVKKTKDLFNY